MASNNSTRDRSGVFANLHNRAAFIDTLILSIWSDRRPDPVPAIITGPSRPIAGGPRSHSLYGRCLDLCMKYTGNLGQLQYAPLSQFTRVPPLRLLLRSESLPLTCVETSQAVDGLCGLSLKHLHVSSLELTCDLRGFSISSLEREIFTRTRRRHEIKDAEGCTTLYFGSRRSACQIRMYDKAADILRVELILRRPWLKANQITCPGDLILLRAVDFTPLVDFREFRRNRLDSVLKRNRSDWRRQDLKHQMNRLSHAELARLLRTTCRVDPIPLLQPSKAGRLIRRMHSNLVF